MKKIFVLFLAVLLVSVTACKNPFFKNMLEGENDPGFHTPNTPSEEGFAVLTLSPDKLNIKVKAKTSDGSAIVVEGCTETSLASDNSTYTRLHATGTVVTLKGRIIELYCGGYANNSIRNKLTALDVQGLSALQRLDCSYNQLTALNVQGCTALQGLDCHSNQLTSLNVKGCTALQRLYCWSNQLTALDVHGLSALQRLYCWSNQLTGLNVQGLSNLQGLYCWSNQLTALNVQGCSALTELDCLSNRLTAEAFTKIFTDLPERDAGDNAKCYLYNEQTGEGNHTDFSTPSAVQAAFQNAKDVKKWKMYKYNTSGIVEEI